MAGPRVVVCGGGVCGLLTAMLLAHDGHEVTVVERDPAPPPPEPKEAWDEWERRGVNQFRLPHLLLPRFNAIASAELPTVKAGLEAAGGYAFNFFGPFRDLVPDVERFDVLTARRPVVEAVVARAAEDTKGVAIRRGTAIKNLRTRPGGGPVPHVVGIETEDGEAIDADLVVVAAGRRSPFANWLEDIGARRPTTEAEDSGFVYYGRHVRSTDGQPVVPNPTINYYGSVALLALPADNGTCGIGIVASSEDAPLRRLRHEQPWRAVMASLPLGPQLLDAEPISPLVAMAGLEDRWNRFVVDGQPVATGVVAVADAWAATNPTLGRGITLGTMHAIALRDTLREVGLDDPGGLALRFDERTEDELTPWYRSTIWHDRHRLADCATAATGVDPRPEPDPMWTDFLRLQRAAAADLGLAARTAASGAVLTELPEAVLADPEVKAKLADLGEPAPAGPERTQLLALLDA